MIGLDSLKESLAKAVRHYRREKGLSQRQLSLNLKMNPRHFQKIEAGQVDLKLSSVSNIAQELKIPPCFLLESGVNHSLRDMNLGCPVKLLDLLDVGLQVNDSRGLIKFANRKLGQIVGLQPAEIRNQKYIWDLLYNQGESEKLKNYIMYLIENRPEPTPYFTKNIRGRTQVPIKVDWNYILSEQGELIGFISLITEHPSW